MYYHMGLFYNDQELGVAYATVSTATAVNGVIGGPIAAAFLKMDGLGGLKGWQWLFLLEGVPTVILAAAIFKYIARGPGSAKFLTAEERSWLQSRWDLVTCQPHSGRLRTLRKWRGVAADMGRLENHTQLGRAIALSLRSS